MATTMSSVPASGQPIKIKDLVKSVVKYPGSVFKFLKKDDDGSMVIQITNSENSDDVEYVRIMPNGEVRKITESIAKILDVQERRNARGS